MTYVEANGIQLSAPHSDAARAWRDSVAVATQRALDALDASLAERIVKAQALVLDGHVTMSEDGHTGFVLSSCEPETTYEVNGACLCPDAEHNEPSQGLCKHRLAVMLYRKTTGMLRERQAELSAVADATRSAMLPEAPVSVNGYVQLHGSRVQVTLRGTNAAAVIADMSAVLAQHVAPSPELVQQFQEPALPDAPVAPVCPLHQREMSASKWGGWFCTSKTDDGQYCPNKVKASA